MEHYVFKLPDLGEGVVEGEIVAWHVEPGDWIDEDQPLCDVMTDKATVTIPSVVAGEVVQTLGQVGQMVPVGSKLVELDQAASRKGNDRQASGNGNGNGTAVVQATTRPTASPPATPPGSTVPLPVDRPLASPAVRRRAREKEVDLQLVKGTGPGERITDSDVDVFLKNQHGAESGHSTTTGSGTTEVRVTGLRRRIAQQTAVSYTHIPHFTFFEQADITELAKLKRHVNEHRSNDMPRLTYLPFFMLAAARTLCRHPEINAHYDDRREVLTQFEAVHLGIATQTDRGLYVPVVRNAEAMDLRAAATELRRVTRAAQKDTISREGLTGSTFTITNLGYVGGLGATPIINHPEVGILGIHRSSDQPVVDNGRIVVRHIVHLSASFDHRVIDGADAAAMMQTLKGYLEYPATIFI
jgi:2-oxoisovalerate dehydrogenase E2 component (dihydrolipoyl transacylase)